MLDINLYCQTTVIKTVWYWHKNRHKGEWNRTESPEINPSLYGQYLTKKARAYNGVKTVSSINGVGRTEFVHAKKKERKKKLDHQPTPYTRIKSKWIKDKYKS